MTALPGTPYHRMARTERHRWWRPLLGTAVLLTTWALGTFVVFAGVFVVALLTGGMAAINRFLTSPMDAMSGPAALVSIGLSLAILAVGLPAILLAARAVQRRPAGTVSSVTGRLRWRWLGMCFGVAVPVLGVSLAVTYLIPDPGAAGASASGWVGWGRFLLAAAVLLALVPLQSAAEEYAFRGWIMQAAGAYLRTPWAGILPGAVLFALGHGLGTGWGFADLILFGLLSGWLVIRTGGLEASIALHTANNLWAFLVAAALGSLAATETAATAPWYLLVIDLAVLPLYAWVIIVLARRRQVARYVPSER